MRSNTLKRVIAVLLSAAMLTGMAACSGSGETSSAGNSESKNSGTSSSISSDVSEEVEEAGATEEVEIYWFSSISGWGPSGWENGVTSSPLTDALKENYGITLNIEQPPTDANTKIGLMIASGDLPDVISLDDEATINQLIDSGKIWKMEDFLKEYDPDSHLLEDFPEDIKTAVINKFGDWYSLPSHLSSEDGREVYPPSGQAYVDNVTKGTGSAIMFNQTIMDELGITQEDVQTEEAFYETCEKVKNSGYTVNGESVIPVLFDGENWIGRSMEGAISASFGILPVDAEGNYRRTEMNPGYKNVLKFVNNLIQDGYLDINTLTIDETAKNTYLDSGRVFCWVGNSANNGKKELIPWTSYGPILSSSGAQPVQPVSLQTGAGWIQTFISTDCENPEQIAQMLSFATSEEGLFLNEYGIEGVDYTIDEDGIVTRTEEGAEKFQNDYKNNMALWPFANTDFAWNTTLPPADDTDAGVFNLVSTALGRYEDTYIYDVELVSTIKDNVNTIIEPSSDLGIKVSQIDSYLKSQKAKIVSAATDEEFETEYNNMVDTLNSYSVTEIDDVCNDYYQEKCELSGETIENVNADIYG